MKHPTQITKAMSNTRSHQEPGKNTGDCEGKKQHPPRKVNMRWTPLYAIKHI